MITASVVFFSLFASLAVYSLFMVRTEAVAGVFSCTYPYDSVEPFVPGEIELSNTSLSRRRLERLNVSITC